MRQAMRRLSICAALLPAASPAAGQDIRQALAQAYRDNPRLAAARAELRAVDEDVSRALAGWRPTVTLTASAGTTDERQTSRTTSGGTRLRSHESLARETASASAVLTQPLYRGGRTVAETRRAEANVLAQRARLVSTEQVVLRDAAAAFTALHRAEIEFALRQDYVRLLSAQRDAARQRLRSGELTRTDLAQAEARLASAVATREAASGTLQSARAAYRRVIGGAPGTLVPPQPLAPPLRDAQAAGELASRESPDVIASLFAERAAREDIAVQASRQRPQLSLEAAASRDDNEDERDERENGLRIGLRLTLPLLQGGLELSQVAAARQNAQGARSTLEADRRRARSTAVEAQTARETAAERLRSAEAQIAAAEVAVRGVQAELLAGSRSQLDLLNAQQELLDARLAAVSARTDLVDASYAVAAATGRLTAADLALDVTPHDPREYHDRARRRWFGTSVPPP
jgi:outer membrane protein